MQLKIRNNNLRCKVASNCLNISEQGEVVKLNKDGPYPSLVALRIANILERKL